MELSTSESFVKILNEIATSSFVVFELLTETGASFTTATETIA